MLIAGRGAHLGLDGAQIFESGIALTVVGCTFFRNFAGFMAGALGVYDAWPHVTVVEGNTDFIHNQAFLHFHDQYISWAHPGPELRNGRMSVSHRDTFYDGGSSLTGYFNFGVITIFWVDGGGLDEPDAMWQADFTNCRWVDHKSWYIPSVITDLYPPLPDKPQQLHVSLVESSMTDFHGMDKGTIHDSAPWLAEGPRTVEVSGTRFERHNALGSEGSVGPGGVQIAGPPSGSVVSRFVFERSAWTQNTAGSGPGVYAQFGNVELQLYRCTFRENVAYVTGGAIVVRGSAAAVLLVAESTFESNAVRVPMDAAGQDATVRVNTGNWLIGDPHGYFVPIWRIDDGAVYGIPWEQCEGAARHSQEAVAKGFPPSWPGLTCANVSYSGPGSSYARVLPLAAGRHTLWTGLLAMVPRASMGWQEAWIEIIDTLGPLYPTMPDT